jgi:hypothetical protein
VAGRTVCELKVENFVKSHLSASSGSSNDTKVYIQIMLTCVRD